MSDEAMAAAWKAAREARERSARFRATEIGKLYVAYNFALISYWKVDGSESISDKRLNELNAKANETETAFLEKLMELAGV